MSIQTMRSTPYVLFALAVLPAFGATSILSIDATQMQAKITVQTDQTGFCAYRASRGNAFSTNIPDLVDNTNTDARPGSIVKPGAHIFILGTRKANDALAAAATYWIGVTCGADSEVSRVFQTRPVQWGNTAPDLVPFNSAKFGNMDHPLIDWNSTAAANTFCDPATHSYCDPNTGVEYWPVTKPGWIAPTIYPASAAGAWAQNPIDISGTGKWTNPTQAWFHASSPPAYATATGGATDKLFIPLANFGCPAGGAGFTAFAGGCTIDDISFDVWCSNATTGGVTGFNLQLSVDGGQTLVGNVITTGPCTSTTSTAQDLGNWPNGDSSPVARPLFKSWGIIPQRNLITPPLGTVSAAGTAVTLTTSSPQPWNYFNLDWKPNTPILINGSYAHLAASPTSSTTLTTVENLGTLAGTTAYSGANFGVVLTKTNAASANVNVSIGLNYSYSIQPYQGVNGDVEMLNQASVSVSRSADGATCGIYTVGCSAGVLNPALTGYLGIAEAGGGNGSLFLFIPRNFDGSPRGETRLLSLLQKPSTSTRVNGNGDSVSYGVQLQGGTYFFDDVDGTAVYSTDQNGKRVWRLKYSESYTGCTGYVAFQPWPVSGNYINAVIQPPITDDCLLYTVMTPLAGGKDIKTQIMGTAGNNGAYQTGLNYLGQTVGPPHTGYDLGWMPGVGVSSFAGSLLIGAASTSVQNHLGVLAAFGDDGSGNGTFVLKAIRNGWSENGKRWAGNHTCPWFNMGTYVFCAIDPLDNFGFSTLVFPNRNISLVSQVNRAGFGATANWDSNTSLTSNTDFYTCPSGLPAPYTSLSSTTNCLQVRMHDPFCQLTPNSTYTFPDGKHEAAEFPCITPGFGVSNASYSKLQDIQVGDYLQDISGAREYFAIVTPPSYNGLNDITFWVLRTAGYTYLNPTYKSNNTDDTFGAGHAAGIPSETHSNGWSMWVIPWGGTQGAVIDFSSPSNTWLYDNVARGEGHAVPGPGSLPGTYNYSMANCGPGFNIYCGTSNLTPPASINIPFGNTVTSAPLFAGIAQPTVGIQSYQNATYSQNVSRLPFFVDFKAINPSNVAGPEAYNGYGNMSMSLVSGTTHTYLVAADCCTSNPSYKAWGLSGYAGRFLLKDVSSPATFGSAADMANYSVCWARNNNECVFGSTPGKLYLSVSQRDIQSACSSANFGNAIPCLSSFGPITGQVIQFRNDRLDTVGISIRKFGFAHNHVGLGYSFTNCRATPDAQFLFCPAYWMDGVRTDWLALRIDALPPDDTHVINRTNFVPHPVTYQGVPLASNIRARFGYAENGGDLLQCTAYGQDCSTEIPSASPNDPFSFTNEVVTRQACPNRTSCTITIPSLPNRILYYVIDRLDSSGNVLQTSVMEAVAVP